MANPRSVTAAYLTPPGAYKKMARRALTALVDSGSNAPCEMMEDIKGGWCEKFCRQLGGEGPTRECWIRYLMGRNG